MSGESASEFLASAVEVLKSAGLAIRLEHPVSDRGDGRSGRVDIYVTDGDGSSCGIELDWKTPRLKSITKLAQLDAGICVLRESAAKRHESQGVVIISGSSAQSITPDLPDWLSPELWQRWVEYRISKGRKINTVGEVNAVISLLAKFRQAGHTPGDVIDFAMQAGLTGLIAPNGGKPQPRDITQISEPDAEIPTGFRG